MENEIKLMETKLSDSVAKHKDSDGVPKDISSVVDPMGQEHFG